MSVPGWMQEPLELVDDRGRDAAPIAVIAERLLASLPVDKLVADITESVKSTLESHGIRDGAGSLASKAARNAVQSMLLTLEQP